MTCTIDFLTADTLGKSLIEDSFYLIYLLLILVDQLISYYAPIRQIPHREYYISYFSPSTFADAPASCFATPSLH